MNAARRKPSPSRIFACAFLRRDLASLRDYVLVAQGRQRVEVFSRGSDDAWRHRVVRKR